MSDAEWSDWSEKDVQHLINCNKEDVIQHNNTSPINETLCEQSVGNVDMQHGVTISTHSEQSYTSDDDLLITSNLTTNEDMLRKQRALMEAIKTRQFKSKESCRYNLRHSRALSSSKYASDFEDSGEEYQPKKQDVNSSDSESQMSSSSGTSLDTAMTPRKRKHQRSTTHAPRKTSGATQVVHSSRTTAALQRSRNSEKARLLVLKYHTTRLDNVLTSNGLKRVPIYPDGNCFFNSVLQQLPSIDDAGELRAKVIGHLRDNTEHYTGFLTLSRDASEEEKNAVMMESLDDLSQDGHWNAGLADCMPLAVANIFKRSLRRIYSSRMQNAVYDISPDLCDRNNFDNEVGPFNLALFAVPGQEHYDAVKIITDRETSSPTKGNTSPRTSVHKTPPRKRKSFPIITPRKRANYQSPVKKQLFRKRQRRPEQWKRNLRKQQRNHGKAYVGRTGKHGEERKMKYKNCEKCRFKCSQKISEDLGNELFEIYWNLGSYEKQRNFICQNVEQSDTKRCKTKRKTTANAFYLPVEESKSRVCKGFFLGILDVEKKSVEYTLKKKTHGVFLGGDLRGKTSSINKTPEFDRNVIKQHIESFPTVASHYTRKDSQRKYLNANLSVKKMYGLYKVQCKDSGR